MNNKWLVAIDLDGTLVNDGGLFSVGVEEIEVINSIEKQGHKPIIVTGRSWSLVKPIYDKLMITTPVVVNNGATVFDPQGRFEAVNSWTNKETIQKIIEEFNSKNLLIDYLIFGEETDYSTRIENMYSMFYENLEGSEKIAVQIDEIHNIKEPLITANIKLKESPESYALIKELTKQYKDYIKFITWGLDSESENFEIEIMNKNIDKFKGINKLKSILRIDDYKVISLGDGENDKEMLRGSEIGVAMLNASDRVKSYANLVTTRSNKQSGVSHFLKKFDFEKGKIKEFKNIQISDIRIKPNVFKPSSIQLTDEKISFTGAKDIDFDVSEIKYVSYKEKFGTTYITLKAKKKIKFNVEELKAEALIAYIEENYKNIQVYERLKQ